MVTLGMMVAQALRRKRKITITTRPIDSTSVNSTSLTEARMVCVRSDTVVTCTSGGMFASAAPAAWPRTPSTVSITLAPGCLNTSSSTARLLFLPGGELAVLRPAHRVADVADPDGAAAAIGDDRRSRTARACVRWSLA